MRPVQAFWFLIPSRLEGSEAQLTKEQVVLLMHDIYVLCVLAVKALIIWGSLSSSVYNVLK